jgi:hypothetical protein
MSTIPQLNKLTLGPLLTTSKGAKQIQISNDGSPLIWTPTEYLEVPFEPSNFSDKESSRLSICFAPTPEIENFQRIFESWCVKALAIKSKEFLGTELTQEQIKEKFSTSLKTSEKGYQSFRAKLNIAGKNIVQCWNQEKTKCLLPSCWKDCKVLPQLHFKSLYIMNKEIGCVIDVKACLLEEVEAECPFE